MMTNYFQHSGYGYKCPDVECCVKLSNVKTQLIIPTICLFDVVKVIKLLDFFLKSFSHQLFLRTVRES